MADISIPRSVDDITPAWLTRALGPSLAGTVEVTEVRSERIGLGVGIMGELWRLSVRYAGARPDLPATLVAKLASSFPENRAHGVNLGLYDAETRFYRDMAVATAARTPRCLAVAKEPDAPDFVVILEDLSGLRMVDQHTGVSAEEAAQAVEALADIHGSWWGRVATDDHAWIPSLVHPRIEMMAGYWPAMWPVFLERFGSSLPEGAVEVGEFVRDNYWMLMQRLADGPWTLLHMDFRCENLLYDDGCPELPVVVLDWQTLGRGTAVYDLAYLLGGSCTVEDRRALEEPLVRRYHAALGGHGVTGYSFDELWDDYRLAHLVAGTATSVLTGASTDLGNERGVQLVETMTARHFAAAVDLAGIELVR